MAKETSKEISLEQALQLERHYVLRRADELGYLGEIKAYSHSKETSSCHEKVRLLNETLPGGRWVSERVVKAVFCVIENNLYTFIFPELKPLNYNRKGGGARRKKRARKYGRFNNETITSLLSSAKYEHTDYSFHKSPLCIPRDMEQGTCTPFITQEEIADLKERCYPTPRILIHNYPKIAFKLVDISVGGKGEEAHKTSLHIPYRAIFGILNAEFGGKNVIQLDFWEKYKNIKNVLPFNL